VNEKTLLALHYDGKFLTTPKEYKTGQRPASFNLDEVVNLVKDSRQ
jgi:hypothetical protein